MDDSGAIVDFNPAAEGGTYTVVRGDTLSSIAREKLGDPGRWREILNNDAAIYGGSGMGNLGMVATEEVASHGRPYSARITLPPLATVWFRLEGDGGA